MINAGIYDGDVVIVQRQQVARNGEIVVDRKSTRLNSSHL